MPASRVCPVSSSSRTRTVGSSSANFPRISLSLSRSLFCFGSTAMAILEHFYAMLRERRIQLVVCGIGTEMVEIMTRSGLRRKIGEPNIFFADNKIFQSTELALARAWSIVGMERRRSEPKKAVGKLSTSLPLADTLMTRKCIRFGNQHQLREAVWLMSQMYRRIKSYVARPLFLQDAEGRLAGELQTSVIIHAMVVPTLVLVTTMREPRLMMDLASSIACLVRLTSTMMVRSTLLICW